MSLHQQTQITSQNYQKSGFSLSSWNYGSFHHCNPYYQKREYLAEDNKFQADETHKEKLRSMSASLNKFGKRKLQEEEKIVTEDYLKLLHDVKVIKGNNSKQSSNKGNSNPNQPGTISHSSGNLIQTYSQNSQESSKLNFLSVNSNKKNIKYQLTYDEWATLKAKQQEIYNKVKSIKETEGQKFEYFNRKVDENYNQVKETNFKEWLLKKNQTKSKEIKIIQEKEELKNYEKQQKENEREEKIEKWIKKQAFNDEIEIKKKSILEKNMQREESKKLRKEEERKSKAEEAYNLWIRKKDEERRNGNMNTKKTEESKMKRNNSAHFKKKKEQSHLQCIIGPYTNAKEMKDIQRKINSNEFLEEYFALDNQNEIEENEEEKNINQEAEDVPINKHENNEESIHELSSIKKDSPHDPQEY
jgi:hypothetical protein